MRLREAADDRPWPDPPERLKHRCVVEDWVSPEEIATREPQEVELTAWRRHRTARREWLDQHRVPREHECAVIPFTGGPRWRTSPSGTGGAASTSPRRSGMAGPGSDGR